MFHFPAGRPGKLLLALVISVILGSEFRGTHDLILLPHDSETHAASLATSTFILCSIVLSGQIFVAATPRHLAVAIARYSPWAGRHIEVSIQTRKFIWFSQWWGFTGLMVLKFLHSRWLVFYIYNFIFLPACITHMYPRAEWRYKVTQQVRALFATLQLKPA
jgi:hypothetical protein